VEPWMAVSSSITGQEEWYGRVTWANGGHGLPRANKGDGGNKNLSGGGASHGVAIARVPKAHAYLGALPAGWVDA
jgi:hypothetical protein